jgi:uncharacterized protein (TIGR03435 family)
MVRMKHLTLAALFLAATLFAPRLLAQASSATPAPAPPSIKFDVVVFKPCERFDLVHKNTVTGGDSITKHCQSMLDLLGYAYGGGNSPYLVKGEPEWVDTEPYDFQAKVAPEDVPAWQKMDPHDQRLMVRAMLVDALKLKLHTEIESRPIYNLVVAKGGPKLAGARHDPNAPIDPRLHPDGDVNWVGPDEAAYRSATMPFFAAGLAARLDRNVVDKTGLSGTYDFNLKPIPYLHYDPRSSNVETTDFAAIIDGVQSLGLKLEPGKADTSVIVIDHIEKPAEN